jgi:release factor glutamine methyltransferase
MRSSAASPSRPRADLLREAGLARLDGELLLAHALGVTREALVRDPRAATPRAAEAAFLALAERRRAGEPVAYLLGRKGFRWLELEVDPRVLVPRPETEVLVEACVELLPTGTRVADVGTGSGAIALALASERPDLRMVGTDASRDALAVARANGARLRIGVEWVEGDLLDPFAGEIGAVVANPPYVPVGDVLPVDVAGFEPALALRAGADGLDIVRRLVPAAAARSPFLALEIGAGQADAVDALCRAAGFAEVEVRPDLAGIPRVVVARA